MPFHRARTRLPRGRLPLLMLEIVAHGPVGGLPDSSGTGPWIVSSLVSDAIFDSPRVLQ